MPSNIEIIAFIIASITVSVYVYAGVLEQLFVANTKRPIRELVERHEPIEDPIPDFEVYEYKPYTWE